MLRISHSPSQDPQDAYDGDSTLLPGSWKTCYPPTTAAPKSTISTSSTPMTFPWRLFGNTTLKTLPVWIRTDPTIQHIHLSFLLGCSKNATFLLILFKSLYSHHQSSFRLGEVACQRSWQNQRNRILRQLHI